MIVTMTKHYEQINVLSNSMNQFSTQYLSEWKEVSVSLENIIFWYL